MGSRYGGLKQLEPVGPQGEALLDYSIAHAAEAGFHEVLFVLRREIEELFTKHLKDRYSKRFPHLRISALFQELNDLPTPFQCPKGRSKPWGTGHALFTARHHLSTPFAVINADDYYGPWGYQLLKKFFSQRSIPDHEEQQGYAMIGYKLENTLSHHGTVSRGICNITENFFLSDIREFTKISKTSAGIIAQEKNETRLFHGNEWVSLNFWGLTPDIFQDLEETFSLFLENQSHDLEAEFYLPSALNKLIHEKKISIQLLPTQDKWLGLTYRADFIEVKKRLSHSKVYF